jgi:hypothetical protein
VIKAHVHTREAYHRKGNIREAMYTGKVEDLERRRWKKDGCGKEKKKAKSMGINPALRPGIRTQRKRNNIRRSPCSLCHGKSLQKIKGRHMSINTRPITVRGIIWSSCCDARSVHWWHWYHCQPTVVAGEFRYRYHSVVSGKCCHHERIHGVVSGAKRTFPLESRWL